MSHNVGLYPYGLIFLLLLWRYRASLRLWMLVQSLMMPYSPIYSLAPLLTIRPAPVWWSLAIWIFYLAMEKNLALSLFGFIFPLLLLAEEIWRAEKQRIRNLHPAGEPAAVVDGTVHEKP
jgi:hypothetical protein